MVNTGNNLENGKSINIKIDNLHFIFSLAYDNQIKLFRIQLRACILVSLFAFE